MLPNSLFLGMPREVAAETEWYYIAGFGLGGCAWYRNSGGSLGLGRKILWQTHAIQLVSATNSCQSCADKTKVAVSGLAKSRP